MRGDPYLTTHTPHLANVDRRGFWSALIGMVKRKHQHNEDGIYLEDIDYESMDPDELSKFFPSR